MSNGLDPSVLAQFQANGWVPPQAATAVNLQAPPVPSAQMAQLGPTDDIYNSPQMQQEMASVGLNNPTSLSPPGNAKTTLRGMIQGHGEAGAGAAAGGEAGAAGAAAGEAAGAAVGGAAL